MAKTSRRGPVVPAKPSPVEQAVEAARQPLGAFPKVLPILPDAVQLGEQGRMRFLAYADVGAQLMVLEPKLGAWRPVFLPPGSAWQLIPLPPEQQPPARLVSADGRKLL
ncbi:MAG TPA: hypothetical protein VK600_01320 [Candidatus Saccharimonadales bacterium]|nr:hypothetical protein [Candidatus Saccharimonadales bacterium]